MSSIKLSFSAVVIAIVGAIASQETHGSSVFDIYRRTQDGLQCENLEECWSKAGYPACSLSGPYYHTVGNCYTKQNAVSIAYAKVQ